MSVSQFPEDPRKIKKLISRYERRLRKEYKSFGAIRDGYGARYLLGPLYMVLGDLPGAMRSSGWFEENFPDDIGEPFHYLCWTLALYRSGDLVAAAQKLRWTMLSNLYLIPHLLGIEQGKYPFRRTMNSEEKEWVLEGDLALLSLWDAPALQWVRQTYQGRECRRVRERYVHICTLLEGESPGPRRSQLVEELYDLRARR